MDKTHTNAHCSESKTTFFLSGKMPLYSNSHELVNTNYTFLRVIYDVILGSDTNEPVFIT